MLKRDLRAKAVAALGGEPVAVHVGSACGRVEIPLVDLARSVQADPLVLGTHQRHGAERWLHRSVSRGILRHAPMSVACVPTTAVPVPAPSIRPCRRVLAAADLTNQGGLALPCAYSMVNDAGTVWLVHVALLPAADPMIGGVPDLHPSKREIAFRAARASVRLRALIPAEAEARGIKTEVAVASALAGKPEISLGRTVERDEQAYEENSGGIHLGGRLSRCGL